MIRAMMIGLAVAMALGAAALAAEEPGQAPAAKSDGATPAAVKSPLADPNFFPITVWMQSGRNAAKYQAIGVNTYVAADPGDLAALKKLGMYAICVGDEKNLGYKDDPTIIAWMHGDEPDNAQDIKQWKSAEDIKKAWPESPDQPLEKWGSYGPPIPPSAIVADYQKIKAADPTRPVLLNLGQGVAWEGYHGRGYRSGKLEDYPEYIKGCDLVSFDIYPVNHDKPAVKDKLEMVAQGVDRLVKWTGGKKSAWDCIECTDMGGTGQKPTPSQVKTEVWMSLIHGSKGLVYFVHIFKPQFNEPGVLADKEMSEAIGKVNKRITELAPVLNSPTVADGATVTSSAGEKAPVDLMVKRSGEATYVFAVDMRPVETKGSFEVKGLPAKATAEVLGEGRKVEVTDGKFADEFKGYEVHLYMITAAK